MLPRQASDPFEFCGVPLVSVAWISNSLPSLSTTAHHILVFFPVLSAELVTAAVLWQAEKMLVASGPFKLLALSACAEAVPTNNGPKAKSNAICKNLYAFIGSPTFSLKSVDISFYRELGLLGFSI